ncbi:hypothetical protein [Achromobacter arsenitoxydans]|uniref:Uncharacterized protein n=1 Tax=Achromobacter arsenitoxydans SY8 TaxID=477184 RepID=H0F9J5_9BURK|nr:hypothetical protein [Achromobacter arsenitoxydans]EHK65260.1 hypothetical protein KYC_17237 [Achromobacter arsenitoxydans SY8]
MTQTTTLEQVRQPAPSTEVVNMFSAAGFALAQRIAQAYQTANAVPAAFRSTITKREKQGNEYYDVEVPNPAALGNCIVAIETAQAVGMSITAVMQNANVIEGRLSWSGKFVIAAINASRRFSPLRFRIKNRGRITASYKEKGQWNRDQRRYDMVEKSVEIDDIECVAWAYVMEGGRRTEEIIEGTPVSIKMAVEEGWYSKPGSKWQTELKHLMLQYRAGSFFGNIHAPDIVMGMGRSTEEIEDVIDAVPNTGDSIEVSVEELRRAQAARPASRPAPADVTDVEPRDAQPEATHTNAKAEADALAQGAAADATTPQPGQPDPAAEDVGLDAAKVEAQINAAKDIQVLDLAGDSIDGVADLSERARLQQIYQARRLSMTSQQQRAAVTTRRRMAAPE